MARAATGTAGRRPREHADGDGEAHPVVLQAPTRGPGCRRAARRARPPRLGRWTVARPWPLPSALRPGAASSCTAERIG